MVELIAAMALTVIVMGAVFGFLARGASTHTVEMQRADLQAQTRHALEQISRDVMLAGTDLPPEFPAFTSAAASTLASDTGIEMVGNFTGDVAGGGPVEVEKFEEGVAYLRQDPVHFSEGDLVLIYDNEAIGGTWMFGLVSEVTRSSNPTLRLLTEPGSQVGESLLPAHVESYNRPTPEKGWVTPVSVVAYGLADSELMRNGASSDPVLWRQLNWGERGAVAHVENLEIRYFVGGTVSALPSGGDLQKRMPPTIQKSMTGDKPSQTVSSADTSASTGESELLYAPVPQPDATRAMDEGRIVRSVRIRVTGRSAQENLMGSRSDDPSSPDAPGHLRQTLSTRVAARNLMLQADARSLELQARAMNEQSAQSGNAQGKGPSSDNPTSGFGGSDGSSSNPASGASSPAGAGGKPGKRSSNKD